MPKKPLALHFVFRTRIELFRFYGHALVHAALSDGSGKFILLAIAHLFDELGLATG